MFENLLSMFFLTNTQFSVGFLKKLIQVNPNLSEKSNLPIELIKICFIIVTMWNEIKQFEF